MKNFIFISPNFPDTYWKFCKFLRENGFNVLGVGDCPYDALSTAVKESVAEYYWVHDLENYDEVFRAVAFFTFKYGKIDFIESNNEYWLERDAMLRTAFNVKSGFQQREVKKIKLKSQMKKYFKKAGVTVARYYVGKSLAGCKKFIDAVGYPVVVKPDSGVGASDTHILHNIDDLLTFMAHKSGVQYIMEEYVDGEVITYDAIIDSKGNPLFETGNVTPHSLMEVVNNGEESLFYIVNEPFEDVKELGRKVVKAFGVKSRFIHFEFFRLVKDQNLGAKGDIVGLEVNMRPSGGISPDMMNYANSVDVYKIWADMIAFDKTDIVCGDRMYCAYIGRRDGKDYLYGDEEIKQKLGDKLKITGRIPFVMSNTMGNTFYIGTFDNLNELKEFYKDASKVR